MAFKQKGWSAFTKNSDDGKNTNVLTKDKSKKKALAELDKIHVEQFDAEDRGDVLTENIAYTYGRKKLAEGKKLYGKKK